MSSATKSAKAGCDRCAAYGRGGYCLTSDVDREHPVPRVVVCECVHPLCTCGALWGIEDVPGPAFEDLPDRAGHATEESVCICWPIRQRVARINRLLNASNLDYRGIMLRDVITEVHGRSLERVAHSVNIAATFSEMAFREETQKGLYLYGTTGGGKTYLASALLNEVIVRTARPGLFVNVTQQLFPRLRNTYENEGRVETEKQVMTQLTRVPFLVLDDLGVERNTKWEAEMLYNVIDARYRKRRPIIATSNLPPKDLESLSRGRIASRITHMCTVLPMPDEDLRQYFHYVVQ